MQTFKEFFNTPSTGSIVEDRTEDAIDETFRQTTAKKLVAEYLKKVSPEEVSEKGFIRYDIESGFYIKFSKVGDDTGIIGYRIDIDSRRISYGQSDILFYDWKTIYSRYYNLSNKKMEKEFNKTFG